MDASGSYRQCQQPVHPIGRIQLLADLQQVEFSGGIMANSGSISGANYPICGGGNLASSATQVWAGPAPHPRWLLPERRFCCPSTGGSGHGCASHHVARLTSSAKSQIRTSRDRHGYAEHFRMKKFAVVFAGRFRSPAFPTAVGPVNPFPEGSRHAAQASQARRTREHCP